ncbi:hypothetical protein Tfer_2189 [Thermincola ferriacetica]|uniref:Peptidase MA-like domain-containing protein n=1 Tax=Thermincola ferriacetica TaxID=281456 RepID=A0A0L6W1G9_9FIRM|nr:peptidase MA family metallohydrolase [Thermincola ferriacetica]KNZ69243.1 hypothetical protein Tfer_2189 [Thermincola ferriacetica]
MSFLDATFLGTNFLLKKTVQLVLALFILFVIVSVRAPMLSKTYIYSIFRELSKAQMMWKTRSWNQNEGEHFIVRYQSADRDIARLVLDAAENAYIPIRRDFAYAPKDKVLIVVYPTRESLSKSFGWDADESAMGVYWAGVIRVLSPKQWIEADTPEDMKAVFETRGPMAHEFTHLVVDYITRGNYPRWLTEGIALYQEFKIVGDVEEEYRQPISGKELYPLNVMDRQFDALADQSLAYRQSYEAVRYIVEKHGESKLWEILVRLSMGETINQSFEHALDMNLDEFQSEFADWLKSN